MLEPHEHLSAEQLSDYLRGGLDASEETCVEEHIGSCLVCARQLREEAQLEALLYEAHASFEDDVPVVMLPTPAAAVGTGTGGSRRVLFQRMAATVANMAAAAAALLLVITPGQPLGTTSPTQGSVNASGTTASASAFVNDALCFPSAAPDESEEDCDDPVAVAMVTDPDDYLSPFDGEPAVAMGLGGRATAAVNACLVEDLACEPG